MIDLNLNLTLAQDRPGDSSFRYYAPARPSNGADRWHLGTAVYRLEHVAVPLDGSEPLVALMRQTRQGDDYAKGGRSVHALRHIASVIDGDVNRISAHVQQVRDALVRVALDEHRSVSASGEIARDEVDYRAGDRTLFPANPSTEHMLPDLADDDMSRVVVRIGAVPLGWEWQRVLDQRSGLWVEVRRAHCGADCDCGGEVRLVAQPGEEREPLAGEEAQLDATMRAQMATWPDDTLALVTLGELRTVLLRAFDTGAARQREGLDVVDGLLRELPTERPLDVRVDVRDVSALKADPTLTGEEVRAVAFGELPATRAACGCLIISGEIRHMPSCPVTAEHEAEFNPNDPAVCAVCGREIEASPLVPVDEPPLRQHVHPSARTLPDVGRPESFEVPGSAYDGVLGYDRHTHVAVTETAGTVPLAVAELRRLLRVAHDHGAGLDDEADCDAFLDRLARSVLETPDDRQD